MLIVVPHLEANTTFNKYWVGGVMFVCSSRVQYIMSSSPDLVKLKTGTLQCGKPFFSNTRQNGEWTETITRQDEKELAMFGT